MSEGKVFRCDWAKRGRSYRGWVIGRREIAGTDTTFEGMDQALWEAILDATGDGENARDYRRPSPGAARGIDVRSFVTLSPESFYRLVNPSALYDGGECASCHRPFGDRTDVPLRLGSAPDGDVARRALGAPGVGVRPPIFSERFVDALTTAERDTADWRRVDFERPTQRAFYEPVPFVPDAAFALFTGSILGPSTCSECGCAGAYLYGPGPSYYLTREAVADAPALWVGAPGQPVLALRRARGEALRRAKVVRQATANAVGIGGPPLVIPIQRSNDGDGQP